MFGDLALLAFSCMCTICMLWKRLETTAEISAMGCDYRAVAAPAGPSQRLVSVCQFLLCLVSLHSVLMGYSLFNSIGYRAC